MPDVDQPTAILALQDLDILRGELSRPVIQSRLRKLGFDAADMDAAERLRAQQAAALDRRWLHHYERAQGRYGRAVAVVRERVCLGCFITLPTSASPSGDEPVSLCESCGRILYWR